MANSLNYFRVAALVFLAILLVGGLVLLTLMRPAENTPTGGE